MRSYYDIAIIGGGILGVSLAYFLQSVESLTTVLIEQEKNVASHSSNRNTGKVHAPFLYDPIRKKVFARAAALGFEMLRTYCKIRNLPFITDGILEVAIRDYDIDKLNRHYEWGIENGLRKEEISLLDRKDANNLEPNVKCHGALFCSKDASVDYGQIAHSLMHDISNLGGKLMTESKVKKLKKSQNGVNIITANNSIKAGFVINVAGGNAIDIAHMDMTALDYTDIHFRGEYWKAPEQYRNLTKMSVYSIPRHTDYPFLDPHWIIRANGQREIGPNAVPVFGPYAYSWRSNLRESIPKIIESISSGANRVIFDRQFIELAGSEWKSSISKKTMIKRVQQFLPSINQAHFTEKGTAGIRSSVINRLGKFVDDPLFLTNNSSTMMHILNYNSPGATGALPVAAMLVDKLLKNGFIKNKISNNRILWDVNSIALKMA